MTYGWCPGVFTPMPAADGLLVRVKPRLSRLGAPTARAIADAVREHGNGRIELTSRANLQIRGLTASGATSFARAMVACGVADADPDAERRRNIIVAPFAEQHALNVAQRLEYFLACANDLPLPAKFGFAVDLADVPADIFLYPAEGLCRIAGAARAASASVEAAIGLARAFLAFGGTRRMADLVASVGEHAIYAAAGLAASPHSPTNAPQKPASYTVAAPELSPATLIRAAHLAGAQGDGLLRITTRREILIAGVQPGAAAA